MNTIDTLKEMLKSYKKNLRGEEDPQWQEIWTRWIDALSAAIKALEKIKPEPSVCRACGGWGYVNKNVTDDSTFITGMKCPDCNGKGMK